MDEVTARIVNDVMSGVASHEPGVVLIVVLGLAFSAVLLSFMFRVE